eukprot:82644-Amphidinium_carterae.1
MHLCETTVNFTASHNAEISTSKTPHASWPGGRKPQLPFPCCASYYVAAAQLVTLGAELRKSPPAAPPYPKGSSPPHKQSNTNKCRLCQQ